ncbi:MAG: hypothetical protein HY939_08045 [Gammaproteobacteria bacterium]|nr:hypothetical protein [Gammaproteobacteria bacterium]
MMCSCSSLSLFDVIGLVGVIITLLAYVLLQVGKMPLRGWYYSFCNALGSFLILISLSEKFNLSAFTMEAIWCFVSVYGIVKVYQEKKKREEPTAPE